MEAFTNGGLTFEVTDHQPAAGTGGGDRVVVALHGFPEDRHCWDGLASALVAAGHRVLAPDQRGYSPGARPPGRRDYRIDLLVGDVLALADQVGGGPIDVIGHDWGAVVAWYLAARHADRVRSLTALSVPHPGAFLTALGHSTQLLHSWYMLLFQLPALPEWGLRRRGGSLMASALARDGLDASTARRYGARAATAGAMTGPLNWYRAIPLSARDRLEPVTVPTLFVWGARDRYVTRAAAEGCAAHVRGPYRFVALDDQTHWLPTAAAEELAPLVVEHLAATAR